MLRDLAAEPDMQSVAVLVLNQPSGALGQEIRQIPTAQFTAIAQSVLRSR